MPFARSGFWVALPFVAPQALWVRRSVPRFAPAAGPTEGQAGSGEPRRLVGIGDSIIAGVGAKDSRNALVSQTAAAYAEAQEREVHWQAVGRSGARTAEIVAMARTLDIRRADVFVVSAGVNDVIGLARLGPWLAAVKDLIDALQNHSPEAMIVVLGLPPLGSFPALPQPLRALLGARAALFDAHLAAILETLPSAVHMSIGERLEANQFSADGYHPSEASYGELASAISEILKPSGD